MKSTSGVVLICLVALYLGGYAFFRWKAQPAFSSYPARVLYTPLPTVPRIGTTLNAIYKPMRWLDESLTGMPTYFLAYPTEFDPPQIPSYKP